MRYIAEINGKEIKGNFNFSENMIDKKQQWGINFSDSLEKTYFYTLDFPKLVSEKNDIFELLVLWMETELCIENAAKYMLESKTIGATFQILPQKNGKDLYFLGLVCTSPNKHLNVELIPNIFDIQNCNKIMVMTDEDFMKRGKKDLSDRFEIKVVRS